MPQTLTIPRPDDWHVHLRDGAMLSAVVPHTAQSFGRAIIMPNLVPPVINSAMAAAYRARILAALPPDADFTPLMTLYATEGGDAADLAQGIADGVVTAVKLYPAHATTNSAHGVRDVSKIYPLLEVLQASGRPLLVHGEVTDPSVDIFDREQVFVARELPKILANFPTLKIVLEHATTAEAVAAVQTEYAKSGRLAATLTAHHLVINRNALFMGGIRPHFYCLPIAKRETHRQALVKAATSGLPCFFLGTDTAPHEKTAKENACGCAGIFTAPVALGWYAQVFERADALDKLANFASRFGADFYGLPHNKGEVTLTKYEQPVKAAPIADPAIVPFAPDEPLYWQVTPPVA